MRRVSAVLASMLALAFLMASSAPACAQQAYPHKPIRLIVPFPAGGSTDPLARFVGQQLTESWGQQVLVDNRPGGNTIIGTEAVAKSAPDGYTLLLTATSHVTYPLLLTTPFDALRDFAPVSTLTSTEMILVLHPSVAAGNLREFIALAKTHPGQLAAMSVQQLIDFAKANPDRLNYASAGTGNPNQLAAELLNMMAGIKLTHIPYKGGGPAITDLVAGQVQAHFGTPIAVISYIKAGKLKAIATTSDTRSSALPQVPTFAEAGLPGFEVKVWYGILAPAGTPKEIIDKLSSEFAKVMAMPDIREKLERQGMNSFVVAKERFGALMKDDMAKYAKVIKTANIKLE